MLRPERIGGFVKGSRERKRSIAHAHNRLTYIYIYTYAYIPEEVGQGQKVKQL